VRRTRINRNRTFNGVVTFLIISLIFVGSGYLIGRFLLASLLQRQPEGEPVTKDSENTTPPSVFTGQIQIKPLTLYRVQIGAYSNRKNAEKIAETALEKGVSAAVMSPDPLYKVYCGVTVSKEAANKIADSVLHKLEGSVVEKGDKLYVATMEVSPRSFTITGEKTQVETIQRAFDTADKALGALISFWDAYYLGQKSQVNLSTMEQDVSAVKADLSQFTPESSLKDAHDTAMKIITELEAAVKGARDAQGGDGAKLTVGMTSLIKLVDTYVQGTKKLD